MNDILMYVIIGVATLVIGLITGRLIFGQTKGQKGLAQREANDILSTAKKEAELLLQKSKNDSDAYKREKSLELKDQLIQHKAELEKERLQKVSKLEEQGDRKSVV